MSYITYKYFSIKFPKYSQLQTRIDSYDETKIPPFMFENKEKYAEAGFFYLGYEDRTVCYYCGGGLVDWQEKDIPWYEHARWFSNCPFLHIHKGKQFVSFLQKLKITWRDRKPLERMLLETESTTDDLHKSAQMVKECLVCLTSERSIVFLPCKHCVTCTSCGLSVDSCVYCRAPITSMIKIYLV